MFSIDKNTAVDVLHSRFAGHAEHMAIIANDIDLLCELIQRPNRTRPPRTMFSPLALAVALHHDAAVKALLDHGAADVNQVVCFSADDVIANQHVALFAAHKSNVAIVRMLLSAPGVDLQRTQVGDCDTICHAAARSDDAAVLAALIADGHAFDAPNRALERPSHVAAKNLNADVIRLLLGAGCDVDALDRDGNSLAHAAATNLNDAVLAQIIAAKCATLGQVNRVGVAPIHIAAHNDNENVVRLLIDAGVDVNVAGPSEVTAAMLACQNYNGTVLEVLLEEGGQLRGTKFTPCQAAAKNHNDFVMSRVIGLGFDVNDGGSSGQPPLALAACLGTAVVVRMLLAAGANVNTVSHGRTVCFDASFNLRAGIMDALIEAGADFRADPDVLSNAVEHGNLDAVIALHKAGFDFATECSITTLRVASGERVPSPLLRFLLRNGANVHGLDDRGESVCRGARAEALAELFAMGANLSQANVHGVAPSEYASHDALLTFVASGANVDARLGHASLSLQPWEAALLKAAGAAVSSAVSREDVDKACVSIAQRQFELLRLRAVQVCSGLAAAELPALQMCEILAHAFAPCESLVPFHRLWAIATTAKHFHQR